jgi:hypothetical protein
MTLAETRSPEPNSPTNEANKAIVKSIKDRLTNEKPLLHITWANREIVIGLGEYVSNKGKLPMEALDFSKESVFVFISKSGGKLTDIPDLAEDKNRNIEGIYVIHDVQEVQAVVASRRPVKVEMPAGFSAWIVPGHMPEALKEQYCRLTDYYLDGPLQTNDLLQSVQRMISEGEEK